MRRPSALLAFALYLAALYFHGAPARAAVVRGVVIDDETGAPLARTSVTLAPLPGQEIRPVTIRAAEHGEFAFTRVPLGWYIVRAARRGFLPSESDQRRAGRPGIPFAIDNDATADPSKFVQMRMYRLSAISGMVLDENGVGLPDISVHVFTATPPLRHMGQGTTDDRGRFHVDRLDPGTYVVHTGATVLEDETSLLPTWFKTGTALADGEPVTLRFAESFNDVSIRPLPGHLFRLTGQLIAPDPVQLTLITDSGRRLITSKSGSFSVDNIPPGLVELVAEGEGCGAWTTVSVQRDTFVQMYCRPLRALSTAWVVRGRGLVSVDYPLIARRIELDGTGPERQLKPNEPILPGMWEIRALTGPEHYVVGMTGGFGDSRTRRNDDWFEVRFDGYLHITLSPSPAVINGVVTASGNPVAGAPVFLERFDPAQRPSRLRLLALRTDVRGQYAFRGLAPGRYRVISSFDFDPNEPASMNQAADLELSQGDTKTQPLEMILP
jgi:hypothetical protein